MDGARPPLRGSPPPPEPLGVSSMVTRRDTLARMDFVFDLLAGRGHRRGDRHPPVPAHAARRRARGRRPRHRLRRHRLLVPRAAGVACSACVVAAGDHRLRGPPLRPDVLDRQPCGLRCSARISVVLGLLMAAGIDRRPTGTSVVAGDRRRRALRAALGFVAARDRCSRRVRARLDDEAAGGAAALRRGRAPAGGRGSRSCSRRSRCSSIGGARSGCCWAGAAAPARSTPACASCDEPRGRSRRSSSSPSSTR